MKLPLEKKKKKKKKKKNGRLQFLKNVIKKGK